MLFSTWSLPNHLWTPSNRIIAPPRIVKVYLIGTSSHPREFARDAQLPGFFPQDFTAPFR